MKPAVALLGLLLLGAGCYYGQSYTQQRASVLEGSKVVVLIRIQATCPEGDVRDVTKHRLRGRTPYLSMLNIALTVGEFESGGKPAVVFPKSPDGSSCDHGWYYVVVPPGPTYLGLGPASWMIGQADPLATGVSPTIERRVDVPTSSKIVYVGTWWTQCTVTYAVPGKVVDTVELAESGITNEMDGARAVARRCFHELGDPVFVEPREVAYGAPRVIRTPPGRSSR